MQKKEYIYVLNDDGTPLMPTVRKQHVNRLLKTHQAHVVCDVPYTIQLDYHSPGLTQPLYGGIDPGRTNIGAAVTDEKGNTVYSSKVTTTNKDIKKHMTQRKEHRQASRRGERLARKRLAKKHNTLSEKLDNGRKLPGCEETLAVKDIINTEARFNNRKKRNLLTPTVRQLILTHINLVKKICSILPVTDWTMEMNKFAFMKLEDDSVRGTDFQNGRMKTYASVYDYVDALQKGTCRFCNEKIEHHHHIIPRSKGGSDLPENIVGLCLSCHEKLHTGKITTELIGVYKKYAGTSALNQAIPYIMKELQTLFGERHVYGCTGYETKSLRDNLGLGKDHDIDASVISVSNRNVETIILSNNTYSIKQFRRHNRALIKFQRERIYYLNGKSICKNRHKRFEQEDDSLDEIRQRYGESITGQLTVKKSVRGYNDMNRIMPGAIFYHNNERHVLSGTLTNGKYYRDINDTKEKKTNYPARDCIITRQNTGLVYVL